jgi:hypothetical protein
MEYLSCEFGMISTFIFLGSPLRMLTNLTVNLLVQCSITRDEHILELDT